MTDFVIIALSAAAAAIAAPSGPAALPNTGGVDVANAPTVGFNVYHTVEDCERSAARVVLPRERRAVCIPVEPTGELAGAY